MLNISCDECGKLYRLGDDRAGLKFRCKECGAVVAIPSAEESVKSATQPQRRKARSSARSAPLGDVRARRGSRQSKERSGSGGRKTSPNRSDTRKKSKVPVWAWIVGGCCSVAVLTGGTLVVLFWMGFQAAREDIARRSGEAQQFEGEFRRALEQSGAQTQRSEEKKQAAQQARVDAMGQAEVVRASQPQIHELPEVSFNKSEFPAIDPKHLIETGTFRVVSISVSPDSQVLAAGMWDAKEIAKLGDLLSGIWTWDLSSGKILRQRNNVGIRSPYSANFSPDGTKICFSGTSEKILFLNPTDLSTESELNTGTADSKLLKYSPDGELLAFGLVPQTQAEPDTIRLHHFDGQDDLDLSGLPDEHSIVAVEFSRDGQQLVTASKLSRFTPEVPMEPELQIWDVGTGRLKKRIVAQYDPPLGDLETAFHSMASSPNSDLFATCSAGNTVSLWNLETSEWLSLWKFASSHATQQIAFSPNGQHLAMETGMGVFLCDVQNGRQLVRLTSKYYGGNTILAFSPDGRMLVSGTGRYMRGIVRVWDLTEIPSVAESETVTQ